MEVLALSAIPETNHRSEALFALCSDGAIWRMSEPGPTARWEQLPPIPGSLPAREQARTSDDQH